MTLTNRAHLKFIIRVNKLIIKIMKINYMIKKGNMFKI